MRAAHGGVLEHRGLEVGSEGGRGACAAHLDPYAGSAETTEVRCRVSIPPTHTDLHRPTLATSPPSLPPPPPKVAGISCDVREAALQMTCVWRRGLVRAFGAARADAPTPPGTVPYWNIVFVDATTTVRVRLAPAEGAAEEGQAGARTGAAATQRQGVFVFARGPMPPRAVPEVYAPWWMIGWL
jgi:hypothetical protein